MSRIELIYQGLADLNVQIEDRSATSPDYFQVTKMPLEFNSGINTFRFKGNAGLFREETPIYIEVLDVNGEPIYYEANLDLESEEQGAVISVFITSDVPPGTGLVILCSSVYRDSDGNLLDDSYVNLRWSYEIYIDPSKRNESEIVYDELPEAFITAAVEPYTNLGYPEGKRFISSSITNLNYFYSSRTGAILTSSLSSRGFDLTGKYSIQFNFENLIDRLPIVPGVVTNSTPFTSSLTVIDSGQALLTDFIAFDLIDFNQQYIPKTAVIDEALLIIEQSASLAPEQTENYHNFVTVNFTKLAPIVGTVEKIRSYCKSSGIGEYVLINETEITESEFGFTPTTASISFAIPTVHRNDKIDFKFEFVNPVGYVAKQVVESVNNLFLGGNTYIAGDDNLLTGSLFVAGATGTGVQISGKSNSSLIRSIGYVGFENATKNNQPAGFVLYSGSIQPLIGSTESYSGVGLELVANSESYFKYTTANGGLLDVRTNRFYLGGNSSYISSSNGNLSLYSENFKVSPVGHVTASAILVTKIPYTDSGATGSAQIMIDTTNAILDATNLSRTVFFTTTEYTRSGSASETNTFWPATSSSLEFIFHGLKAEYKYTVAFQQKLEVSLYSGGSTSAQLRFRLYAANSGSANDSSMYDANWILVNQIKSSPVSLTSTGIQSRTLSEFFDENNRVISLTSGDDQYQGKLLKGVIDFEIDNSSANVYTSSFKNITVTAGRGLGSFWGGIAPPIPIPK